MAKKRNNTQVVAAPHIPPQSVTAKEMAAAMTAVAHKLHTVKIIDEKSRRILLNESQRVGRSPSQTKWNLTIDRCEPISFAPFSSRDGKDYVPRIV